MQEPSSHLKKIILISVLLHLFACNNSEKNIEEAKTITIDILPFSDISKSTIDSVYHSLRNLYPRVILLEQIKIPKNAYYPPRNRYRADSIIQYLSTITPKNHITLGLTSKDISHTKGKIPDYGIMGLGWLRGNSCIVSTFRLSKENRDAQLYKFCLHELGHTAGLIHCIEKTCFMRDAEGRNHSNEETKFCKKCKSILVTKGWTFIDNSNS